MNVQLCTLNTALAGHFGEAMVQLGGSLQKDPMLNRQINRFARRAVAGKGWRQVRSF